MADKINTSMWNSSDSKDVYCRRHGDTVEYVYLYPAQKENLIYNGKIDYDSLKDGGENIAETLSRMLSEFTIAIIAKTAKNIYGRELPTDQIFGFGVSTAEEKKFLRIKGILA